jgi:replicative DNA helicase
MLEPVILSNLLHCEKFARKVLPFLKEAYFQDDPSYGWAFIAFRDYFTKYNRCPSVEAMLIDLHNRSDIAEQACRDAVAFIPTLIEDKSDFDWLIDKTEQFCKDKALYIGIQECVGIFGDKEEKKSRDSIPSILQEALAVSFDNSIGHDFLEDAQDRFDFYHAVHRRIPFDLEYFNRITNGGFYPKTLNVLIGGVHMGKSQFMCHMAGANLTMGKKVLYITLEMEEKEIAKRIDANLLNVSIGELDMLSREVFTKKIDRLRKDTLGKLVIKEYPQGTAGAGNFRYLLSELKLKKNFVPDIIYVDYLNICCSNKVKFTANLGSYNYVKAIAEEFRALAQGQDLPIVTATQLNREGFKSSDPDMTDTAESFGLPATCDFLAAIIVSEDLTRLGQKMVKQLKNRYRDFTKDSRFVIKVDNEKMRLADTEQSAQENVMKEQPVTSVFRITKEKAKDFK